MLENAVTQLLHTSASFHELQKKVVGIPLFLFSGQLLLYIRHLGSCWKGKDDTVCMYVFNGDTGVLFYFALGQLTVVS